MCADDTTLTCSAENADTLQVKMNSDLSKIPTWLKVNKLTLNVKKTKYMLIGSGPKLELLSDNFTVKVNNIPMERVIVYKSLGVSIDENLFWITHIDEIWFPQAVLADMPWEKAGSEACALFRWRSVHSKYFTSQFVVMILHSLPS